MHQAHIFYSGSVQGVGFRFTTQNFAMQLGLKGWVKNLRDGRVEIVVEGPKEKIEELCQNLESQFGSYVHSKEIDFFPAEGKFRTFDVTH